jgi:hypothetical protein
MGLNLKKINQIGKIFGLLLIIGESAKKHNRTAWICMCECNTIRIATGNDLQRGKVKTCSSSLCRNFNTDSAHEAVRTHKMSNTRLYRIWGGMRRRCGYHPNYINIKYCEQWDSFESFMEWALKNNYSDDFTLDRIDVYGNYTPENCRWATHKEQSRNTTKNRNITHNNKTQCVMAWAEELDINSRTLLDRLNRGWSLDRAFNTPARSGYEKRSV